MVEEETKPEEEAKPEPKTYTAEEMATIARRVETPQDNTPPYIPQHKLSPEFDGTTNYELGVKSLKTETEVRLEALMQDPSANKLAIKETQEALKTLDCLYENYHLGMNVFRTAKGGRDKLRV